MAVLFRTAAMLLLTIVLMLSAVFVISGQTRAQELVLHFQPGTNQLAPESAALLADTLNGLKGHGLNATIIGHAAPGEAAAPPAGLAADRALTVARSVDAYAGAQQVSFQANLSGTVVEAGAPQAASAHISFTGLPTQTASR